MLWSNRNYVCGVPQDDRVSCRNESLGRQSGSCSEEWGGADPIGLGLGAQGGVSCKTGPTVNQSGVVGCGLGGSSGRATVEGRAGRAPFKRPSAEGEGRDGSKPRGGVMYDVCSQPRPKGQVVA